MVDRVRLPPVGTGEEDVQRQAPAGDPGVELGYVFDRATRKVLGLWGVNPTDDDLFVLVTVAGEDFRLDLPPQTTSRVGVRLPARAQIATVTRGDGTEFLPWERTAVHRRYAHPRRASPVVLGVTETEFPTASTTHNVVQPSVTDADDGIIVGWEVFGGSATTPPSGYISRGSQSGIGAAQTLEVFVKVADGTEDGASVNFATAASDPGAAQIVHVEAGSWAEATDGVEVDFATGDGSDFQVDPGPNSPSWGSADTLWIVYVAVDNDEAFTGSTGPDGTWTFGILSNINSTEDHALFSAYKVETTATMNPNTGIGMDNVRAWIAATVAVNPTVASPPVPSHGWVMDDGTIDLPYQHDALPVFNPNDAEPQVIDAAASARATPRAAAAGKVVRPASARAYVPARAQAPGVVVRKSTARTVAAARAAATGVVVRKSTARAVAPVRASAVVELFVVGRPAARAAVRATATATLVKTATASGRVAASASATGRRVLSAVARDSLAGWAAAAGRIVRSAVARAVAPLWATVQADVLRDATAAARAAIRASGSATVRHPASARAVAAARIAVTGSVVRASSAQARAAARITVNATILSAPVRAKAYATPRAAATAKVIVEASAAARCAPRVAVTSSVVHEASAQASAVWASHATGRRVAEASARAAATFRVGATARLLVDASARGDAAAVAQAHAALLMGAQAQAWMTARITVRLQSAGQVWYRADPVDADPSAPAHATGGPAYTRAGPGHTSGGPAFTRMTGRDRPPLWN